MIGPLKNLNSHPNEPILARQMHHNSAGYLQVLIIQLSKRFETENGSPSSILKFSSTSIQMGNMKIPTIKTRTRKRVSDTDLKSSDQRKRTNDDIDLDLDLSEYVLFFPFLFHFLVIFWRILTMMFIVCSDLKGIVSALNQIKERAHKDDQKKNEETISR